MFRIAPNRRRPQVHQGQERPDGRSAVHRFARHLAAFLRPAKRAGCDARRRHRLRWLIDPRLPGDPRKRHAGRPGPDDGIPRSVSPASTTLVLICNIRDPVTGQPYSRDPRYIAQKAENYLKSTGVADTAISARRRSSSFSTTSASTRASTAPSTHRQRRQMEPRQEKRRRISATSCATKKATSPSRRPTACRTSAPR